MSKKIIVTEKPSVARTYAEVLGVTGKQNGYIENDEWIITWCVGHLVTLSYPEVYDGSLKEWSFDTLPFLPEKYKYEVIKQSKKQFDIVKQLYNRKDVSTIYYAGDAGREGIYIQDLVRRKAKPLEGIKELVVWIDSQTEAEIKRGIAEAKPISEYKKLIDSAYMRAIEDYAVGINFSRALSIKFGYYRDKRMHSVSVGRVMSTVLGMVVRREQEIENFKETKFYKINASNPEFKAEWKATEGTKYFNSPDVYNNVGFLDEVNAKRFISSSSLGGDNTLTVKEVKNSKEQKYAPSLYNLAELQGDCSKEFKISPQQTLDIAQSLYEKKLTTYPRTDARVLSTAVCEDLNKTAKGLAKIGILDESIMDYLTSKDLRKIKTFKRYVDDSKITDHYAIIPTGEGSISGLTDLELSVYKKICLRFASIFYPPAEYTKTEAVLRHSQNEFFFINEKVLMVKGYLDVVSPEEKIAESKLSLKEGEVYDVSFGISEGKTTPPKRYTSGSIILAMENAGNLIDDEELRAQIKNSGIGTSATRAGIIEKLIKIKHINLNKKTQVITPAEDGIIVYKIINKTIPLLLDAKMTASWEKGLEQIASGEVSRAAYQSKLNQYVTENVEKIRAMEGDKAEMEKEVIGKCPKCGSDVMLGQFGAYCSGKCGMYLTKARGVDLKDNQIKDLLEGKKILMKGLKSKSGNTYDAYFVPKGVSEFTKKDGSTGYGWAMDMEFADNNEPTESNLDCPKCGEKLKKTRFNYECSCGFKIPHTIAKKELNEKEMASLLAGKTAILDGFTSKAGKKFMAALEYDLETERINFVFEGDDN